MEYPDLTQGSPQDAPQDQDGQSVAPVFRAVTGQEIADQAKTWIGTPYHHAACCKGVGVDCARLLEGVGLELGLNIQVQGNYPFGDNLRLMVSIIEKYCDPVNPFYTGADFAPGDILVFSGGGMQQHTGISDGEGGFVHSYSSIGAGVVCLSELDRFWRRRLIGAYRFKGLS